MAGYDRVQIYAVTSGDSFRRYIVTSHDKMAGGSGTSEASLGLQRIVVEVKSFTPWNLTVMNLGIHRPAVPAQMMFRLPWNFKLAVSQNLFNVAYDYISPTPSILNPMATQPTDSQWTKRKDNFHSTRPAHNRGFNGTMQNISAPTTNYTSICQTTLRAGQPQHDEENTLPEFTSTARAGNRNDNGHKERPNSPQRNSNDRM
ncbi:uncharacterized protein LOC126427319 [Schistocerca serialis cubense]|uniref:uncharacterized protein LOC126427319 n=1 Tax=Schistocerca serialis cubense TaxID=2023355 RepID=UPI00214E803C|nr:uncharacterized protein LOC126427319 [Schistocerca serialis cubense]